MNVPTDKSEREQLIDAIRSEFRAVEIEREKQVQPWTRVQSWAAFAGCLISMIGLVGGVWVGTATRMDRLEYMAAVGLTDRAGIRVELGDLRRDTSDTNVNILARLSELSTQIGELRGDLRRQK